jgi:histone H3/H4
MSDNEILIVVSKLKAYIKSAADMNTAGNVAPRLSDIVRGLCDEAVQRAKADGRKTVMDRDF